jgi:acyl phosphate:glycerol-3-phosphate acyltransferase
VIYLARSFGLNLTWQMLSGVAVVLGHDFPIFAEFRGGQGMAASVGTMSILFWQETLIALITFTLVYLLTHNFDLSAAAGLGLMVFYLVRNLRPTNLVIYSVVLLLTIPAKKIWDAHHRLSGGI